jgi:hypothetical protein
VITRHSAGHQKQIFGGWAARSNRSTMSLIGASQLGHYKPVASPPGTSKKAQFVPQSLGILFR